MTCTFLGGEKAVASPIQQIRFLSSRARIRNVWSTVFPEEFEGLSYTLSASSFRKIATPDPEDIPAERTINSARTKEPYPTPTPLEPQNLQSTTDKSTTQPVTHTLSDSPPEAPSRHTSILPQTPETLSHLNAKGEAHMVSISSKLPTRRTATATSNLLFSHASAYQALTTSTLHKGDCPAVARIAGIMAAKKTSDLIPLAHPGLGITGIQIDVEPFSPAKQHESATEVERWGLGEQTGPYHFGGVAVTARVECEGKTGVEMEALIAATVTGLTVYDMCKGIDKGMLIQGVRVTEKRGGKSGGWVWDEQMHRVRKVKETGSEIASSQPEPEPSLATDPTMVPDPPDGTLNQQRLSDNAMKKALQHATVPQVERRRPDSIQAKAAAEPAEPDAKVAAYAPGVGSWALTSMPRLYEEPKSDRATKRRDLQLQLQSIKDGFMTQIAEVDAKLAALDEAEGREIQHAVKRQDPQRRRLGSVQEKVATRQNLIDAGLIAYPTRVDSDDFAEKRRVRREEFMKCNSGSVIA